MLTSSTLALNLCALSVPRLRAQPSSQLLRVAGFDYTYLLDEGIGEPGEYHRLDLGKHDFRISGAHHTSLELTLDVTGEGIAIALSRIKEGEMCFSGDSSVAKVRVDRWPVKMVRDPSAPGAWLLRVQEQHLAKRNRPYQEECVLNCCGWDKQSNWPLRVTATPVSAKIYAGGYLNNTDAILSLPYGEMRNGYAEEIIVRVIKRSYIGCSYRLSSLRRDGVQQVNCVLQKPTASPQSVP
ncbi:MAG: hypothetical protein JWL61_1096 [Gemmatimonadetes bacterium]|nr:hypothetical protein [Gemmatimonadota bacterium]